MNIIKQKMPLLASFRTKHVAEIHFTIVPLKQRVVNLQEPWISVLGSNEIQFRHIISICSHSKGRQNPQYIANVRAIPQRTIQGRIRNYGSPGPRDDFVCVFESILLGGCCHIMSHFYHGPGCCRPSLSYAAENNWGRSIARVQGPCRQLEEVQWVLSPGFANGVWIVDLHLGFTTWSGIVPRQVIQQRLEDWRERIRVQKVEDDIRRRARVEANRLVQQGIYDRKLGRYDRRYIIYIEIAGILQPVEAGKPQE